MTTSGHQTAQLEKAAMTTSTSGCFGALLSAMKSDWSKRGMNLKKRFVEWGNEASLQQGGESPKSSGLVYREKSAGGGEGVDISLGFVAAETGDSGKAEGEAGIVAGTLADGVEGDFENHARLNLVAVAGF